jgi:glyoxylase-like metal-dependent hydrolase (beta-lactamase superfamily II)
MAEPFVRSIQVGAAAITLLNVGDLRYGSQHGQPISIPVLCVLIQLPDVNVLVDAGIHDLTPDSPFSLPHYQPPPALPVQLAALGVPADQIAHVVITHTHFDHFNGVTEAYDGGYAAAFPNARYWVGRADFEHLHPELADLASRTLAVLEREGRLDLVSGTHDLNEAVRIIPAPGESPGHQIVRIHSEGQTFYCLGDLYHDTNEVMHPDHMPGWADGDALRHSRSMLTEAALAENALLTATHIRSFGRLRRTDTGIMWEDV